MNLSFRAILQCTALGLAMSHVTVAMAADGTTDADDQIIVNGLLPDNVSASATGLTLTLAETPQAITVLTKDRIRDFALTNVNDLLDQVVGVNVDRQETDRTYFNSRGFDITNFQVDGIGLPLLWGLQTGDLDTALWERVEVVRGANGLMTGVGNPSATVNYVRKRPTEDFQASVTGLGGSLDLWRMEADVSGPLDDAGAVQVRAIFAHDEHDSQLDYNHVQRNVFGAILSWNITPALRATAGYTRQENDADGVLWGAIPLTFTDGTRIPLGRSATTSADWTYWDTTDQSAFGELSYAIGNGWSIKGVYTYKRLQEQAKLLYAYGYPDRETGLGVGGMSGIYPADTNQYLADFYASGPYTLLGREHELSISLSSAISKSKRWEGFAELLEYPSVYDWGTAQVAEPDYPNPVLEEDMRDKIQRVTVATHLNLADPLKAVVGFSATKLKGSGTSYSVDQTRKNSKVTPYVGVLYDVTPNIKLYASYTSIFSPQKEVDVTNHRLDPATGSSIEAGIKSEWLDGRLYAAATLFRAKQKNLAEYAGTFGDDEAGRPGSDYSAGVDTTSKGFEIELTGRVTENWQVSGGFTAMQIHDQDGNDARIYLPTRTLKLSTTYAVPELNNLKLGAQLRAQNRIRYVDSGVQAYEVITGDVLLKQGGYAVLDLMAGIDVVEHVRASLNVKNVTDKKYLGSLTWGQAFYAAPRTVLASIGVSF